MAVLQDFWGWRGNSVGMVVAAVLVCVGGGWLARRVYEWLVFINPGVPAGLKLPPGSMGWPFIGHTLSFIRVFNKDPDTFLHRFFFSKYKESDGIYKTHLFGSPSIVVCSPKMIKFVLAANASEAAPFPTGWPSTQLMGANSMVVLQGPRHQRMRRLLLQAIGHPLALQKALHRLQARFKSILAHWARQRLINLRDTTKRMTFEDICMSFLSLKPGQTTDSMQEYFSGLMEGIRAQPINIWGFSYHKALKCRKELLRIVSSIIKERRSMIKIEKDDFLDVLLEEKDDNGQNLTDEEICDNMIAFLLGGHESTSYTILWSMILLAKHPNVLRKIREEHKALESSDELISTNDLKKMTYTNLFINELLRLVNIAPFIFRRVAKDDVNFKGYYFPKGWKVIIWLRAPHMDPTYFPNPYKFDPERFKDQLAQPHIFSPFSCGPRQCPGSRLLYLSTCIFLHHLVLNYKWELLDPNCKVKYLPHPMPIDGGKVQIDFL